MPTLFSICGQQRRRIVAADTAFVIRVKTDNAGTSGSNQFTLPLFAGTYDYNVDWGDSTNDNYTDATSRTHTYAVAGTYDIRITGTFPRIYFNNTGDRLKLIEILNWGELGAVNSERSFYGCANITTIPGGASWFDTVNNGNRMFENTSLTSLPAGMTLSALTSGVSMFQNTSLTSLPADMTLSALTNGFSMFQNTSLTSLPADMTLSALTNGFSMFRNTSLTSLPADMTLSALTSGGSMFNGTNLTSLPADMTLSALTNGNSMFNGVSLNTTRYSKLLEDLESLNPNNSIIFGGGNSKYNSAGETARNILTASPRLWSITDGGLEA